MRRLFLFPLLHTKTGPFSRVAKDNVKNFAPYAFLYKLDVLYASQLTFSKVTVTIFDNYVRIHESDKGSGTEIKKTILTVKLQQISKASAFNC